MTKNSEESRKAAAQMRELGKTFKEFPLTVVNGKPCLVIGMENRDRLITMIEGMAVLMDDIAELAEHVGA